MARQRIDIDDVIDSAVELVDDGSIDDLALSRVADELGVQSSALYNHVDGLEGLRHQVAVRASENLADTLLHSAVARAGDDALRAVAIAYRQFALEHSGQYASTLLAPTDAGDEALIAAQTAIIDVFARILATYGFDDSAAVHQARIVRSAIHGFVALEATDAFTNAESTTDSFELLIDFILRGVR